MSRTDHVSSEEQLAFLETLRGDQQIFKAQERLRPSLLEGAQDWGQPLGAETSPAQGTGFSQQCEWAWRWVQPQSHREGTRPR